jgi:hypothetical protein
MRRSSIHGGELLHLIYAPKKPLWIKGLFDVHESSIVHKSSNEELE